MGSHPDFPESQVGFDSELSLYRTIPYPSEVDLERFYTKEYRDVRKESPDVNYVAFMRHRAAEQSRFILNTSKRNHLDSVLDIGCGCGELLNAFEPYTKKLVGYETDPIMASHAKAQQASDSVEIRNQHYTPGNCPEKFELVTMSHVLEHIPEPVDFLTLLRTETISPGGALFLEVPNEPDFWVESQIQWQRIGLGHLNYFTSESLENTLTSAGFVTPTSRECGNFVKDHMKSCRPKTSLFDKIRRRLPKKTPLRYPLPDYSAQDGSEPRIYLQVIAFNPTN
ncbi:MAG: class I SAM-dependent methyltransferase [Luteolibacter sp.]